MTSRTHNERKFMNWQELENGGRRYWYDVIGQDGFRVRYIKVVNANEKTVSVVQEI